MNTARHHLAVDKVVQVGVKGESWLLLGRLIGCGPAGLISPAVEVVYLQFEITRRDIGDHMGTDIDSEHLEQQSD